MCWNLFFRLGFVSKPVRRASEPVGFGNFAWSRRARKPVVPLKIRVLKQSLILIAAVLSCPCAISRAQSAKEILDRSPAELVAVLKNPAAANFEKAKACQRLAVVGTLEAVPVLASLLANDELNIYARVALEGLRDSAADGALRDAATKLKGRPLVGVIDSIGQRRDALAVELLSRFLTSEDSSVVSAAARALGSIGTEAAASPLRRALAASPSETKPSVADACLVCAEHLAAAGRTAEAVTLYEAISAAEVPSYLRVAGLRGQFRLRGQEATDLLLDQIQSSSDDLFNLGLAVAREMSGSDVTAALTGQLERLGPERQAKLLLALGDRRDPPPLSAVLAAVKSDAPAVREAAIQVLAKFGDPSALAILLDTAIDDGPLAPLARERLKAMSGSEADRAILDRLSAADAKTKAVLFDLVGARRIVEAAPMVRAALGDADTSVRSAALAAFAMIMELNDIDVLLQRALNTSSPDASAAQAALRTAALRIPEREACATTLAASIEETNVANKIYLLELLGEMGGAKALATVVAEADSQDDQIKDAATRILGAWPSADAAPALLEIAEHHSEAKYRVRAMRGFLRIARQLQLTAEERLDMFRTALEAAERDDEKRLALDILTRIPSVDTLNLAVSYLDDAALRDSAADAAVKIAPRLLASHPHAVAQAMRKIQEAAVGGNPGSRAAQLLRQAQGE